MVQNLDAPEITRDYELHLFWNNDANQDMFSGEQVPTLPGHVLSLLS